MRVFGIDSSDDFVSVGIYAPGRPAVSRASEHNVKKNVLHTFLMDFLSDSGISFSEIDCVSVAVGPGSFTGLRVGLAAAKGICWSWNLPLVGVSSLNALAGCVKTNSGKFLVIKDARREEFYYAGFSVRDNSLEQIIPDSVAGAGPLMETVADDFQISGPGVPALRNSASAFASVTSLEYDEQAVGGRVALLGHEMLEAGKMLDISKSVPVYVRTPRYAGSGI